MNQVSTIIENIQFSSNGYTSLTNLIEEKQYSKLFILTDSNTINYCLPILLGNLATLCPFEILEIEPDEENKNIETCTGLWESLSSLGADRKSLLLALGGGVVTDIGGFVAATYKRGIDCVCVPTTLLAMVDASLGGKTGVDLGILKNQVGVFQMPELVVIDCQYLETLNKEQMLSGLAEMFKHGLIADVNYWRTLCNLKELTTLDLEKLIMRSIEIKAEIATIDPKENGIRKALNFGHTLGHAIESYFLSQTQRPTILHGFAVATAMILEAYLSYKKGFISKAYYNEIKAQLLHYYPKIDFSAFEIKSIMELLIHDKKNSNGKILFSLIEANGSCRINQEVNHSWILEAFEMYQSK